MVGSWTYLGYHTQVGMAILSMDLDTHGYPTRLGKGMEHISAHGSVDMDTHEQTGWAWSQFVLHGYPMDTRMTCGAI